MLSEVVVFSSVEVLEAVVDSSVVSATIDVSWEAEELLVLVIVSYVLSEEDSAGIVSSKVVEEAVLSSQLVKGSVEEVCNSGTMLVSMPDVSLL